jgi:hypothetical protein
MTKSDLEAKFPAVGAAYDFVLPSYTFLIARFEAADTRLTTLLTLTATLSLGAPILAGSIRKDISFLSAWFLAAMVMFLASVILGLVGRVSGRLKLPDPMVIFTKSLHHPEWEFKKNAIAFAGQHFAANSEAILRKGNAAACVAALLVVEIACLICWIALVSEWPGITL